MKIPFVDLAIQYHSLKQEIDTAIENVIFETAFIGGNHVKEFEEKFAKMYGVKHCISTANGTESLYIIMKMLGISAGDEVITAAYSWISSSETISQTGAKPVFVDVDEYFTIDASKIEEAITPKTKAIIPVHIHGQVANMEEIIRISNKYNLLIIEDCAQSHFSAFKGVKAGTMGIAGSFSFYPGKNLGAYGDAGCIITNNDELALKFRLYSKHGAINKHEHKIEGINSRMDGIQAAILNVKLDYILDWNDKRRCNAIHYYKNLKDTSEVELPKVREGVYHTYHLFVIKVSERDKLKEYLEINGIETAIHYPVALHNMEAYQYLGYKPQTFSKANENQYSILSLPMYPELREEHINYICKIIKLFYKNN